MNEIIDIPQSSPAILQENFVELAEKRIEFIKRTKELALKITNIEDWVLMGKKPYLMIGGCKKVARLFGVSWKITDTDKSFDQDSSGHYTYTYTADFWLSKHPDEKITEVGTKSTHNNFFGKVNKKPRPISQIDETNIKKSALTNCLVRGITSLLGLSFTLEEVNKQVNLTGSRTVTHDKESKAVSYGTGSQGGNKISEPQSKRLYAIYKGSGITDDQMKDYLLTEYDLTSSKDIQMGKMYEDIVNWAQAQKKG